jgi:hypothetical protein
MTKKYTKLDFELASEALAQALHTAKAQRLKKKKKASPPLEPRASYYPSGKERTTTRGRVRQYDRTGERYFMVKLEDFIEYPKNPD